MKSGSNVPTVSGGVARNVRGVGIAGSLSADVLIVMGMGKSREVGDGRESDKFQISIRPFGV